MISTDQKLLQLNLINETFDSDMIYWAKGTTPEALKAMLSKSLCFGVYALPQSSSEIAGPLTPFLTFNLLQLFLSKSRT